jgi:hypothetical protein
LGALTINRVGSYTPKVLFYHRNHSSGLPAVYETFQPLQNGATTAQLDLMYELMRTKVLDVAGLSDKDTTSHYFYGLVPYGMTFQPVYARPMIALGAQPVRDTLNVRASFIAATRLRSRDARFDVTFADLQSATKYFQHESLVDAAEALRDEIDRSGFVFTIAGVSVPAQSVMFMSPILLVGLMAYTWVTLRTLGAEPSLRDPVVSVVFFVSALLMPVVALTCVTWKDIVRPALGWESVLKWTCIVIAIIVGRGMVRDWGGRLQRAGHGDLSRS